MKILVCIKQVPDTEANPELNQDSLSIKEDNIAFRMNRYDEYALEEALLIKDEYPETVIDVITVGPERSTVVLKKSLEKGADKAVHIKTADINKDAYETASLIVVYAADKKYDLIFAGVMSEDIMQCQTGPMIASLLSMPCAVSIVKSEINYKEKKVKVESELEGGMIETISIELPCLLTFQTGINQPRYPSLSNVLKARNMIPESIDAESFSAQPLNSRTVLNYPPSNIKGVILEGTSDEKAEKLAEILHEKGILLK